MYRHSPTEIVSLLFKVEKKSLFVLLYLNYDVLLSV